jgi:hypothetical protein
MSNLVEEQVSLFPAPLAEKPGKKRKLQFFWIGLVLAMVLSIAPCVTTFLFTFWHPILPLSADANTLYLADWSKDMDGWTGGDQWHWKQPGVISSQVLDPSTYTTPSQESLLFLAPYHPTDADIQIDAQIKSLDWGNTFVGDGPDFGILVGIDGQYMGYLCAAMPNYFSHVIDWSEEGITGYSGIGEAPDDFRQYVNFTVKIQHQVATFYLNGQWIAQATLTNYQPGGAVGLLSLYGAIEVQGFRIDKLS